MSDTGWVSPGTATNNSASGSVQWYDVDYIKGESNYAYAAQYSSYLDTHYLVATNFGFSIPAGATVDGVEVEVNKKCTSTYPDVTDVIAKIVKADGSFGSENKAKSGNWASTATTYTYGGNSDTWSESLSPSDINDSDFGFVLQANERGSIYLYWIKIKVYYTESSGTEANSERGLYVEGYDTSNSERPLYIQGYLTNNSERNLYLEGNIESLYSRESDDTLGTDDSNLATTFSTQDYTDVGTDNDTYVDLEGVAQYFKFLFKKSNANENNTDDFKITWKGKSTLAPSSSTVYLQIYNRDTESWTTLDSDDSTGANTKFTLESTVNSGLSNYYDANYVISARVYQDGVV